MSHDPPEHAKSQCELILQWLQQGKPLTGLEALQEFGTICLPRRVLDLKKQGYNIQCTMVTKGKKRVGEYHFVPSEPTQTRLGL